MALTRSSTIVTRGKNVGVRVRACRTPCRHKDCIAASGQVSDRLREKESMPDADVQRPRQLSASPSPRSNKANRDAAASLRPASHHSAQSGIGSEQIQQSSLVQDYSPFAPGHSPASASSSVGSSSLSGESGLDSAKGSLTGSFSSLLSDTKSPSVVTSEKAPTGTLDAILQQDEMPPQSPDEASGQSHSPTTALAASSGSSTEDASLLRPDGSSQGQRKGVRRPSSASSSTSTNGDPARRPLPQRGMDGEEHKRSTDPSKPSFRKTPRLAQQPLSEEAKQSAGSSGSNSHENSMTTSPSGTGNVSPSASRHYEHASELPRRNSWASRAGSDYAPLSTPVDQSFSSGIGSRIGSTNALSRVFFSRESSHASLPRLQRSTSTGPTAGPSSQPAFTMPAANGPRQQSDAGSRSRRSRRRKRKHVDLAGYSSSELLRLLASLLQQIAKANDTLSSPPLDESPNAPSVGPSSSTARSTGHSPTASLSASPDTSRQEHMMSSHSKDHILTASKSALHSPNATLCFHARNIPSIGIEAYLLRILKYCPTTNEVFVSLLVYFDRMAKRGLETADRSGPLDGDTMARKILTIDSYNIHRLVIAGVTVASKFFSDVFYTNSRYAKVGGLPLHELNQLELQFLLLNDFSLVIPLEEMQQYADHLLLHWQDDQRKKEEASTLGEDADGSASDSSSDSDEESGDESSGESAPPTVAPPLTHANLEPKPDSSQSADMLASAFRPRLQHRVHDSSSTDSTSTSGSATSSRTITNVSQGSSATSTPSKATASESEDVYMHD
ncbi:uncharacterized protein L969DRAFT_92801 [Mixia osmundae IAM 14324]|uniref:Cyclin-domain-containing protein n=1 Tax=Mixia osmundae (strain CBS 9802 / IAM 14324 / JCM 22182 / KY 12970) TaxID=764103 RepID=G7DYL4_MIXOS|nr:uncharacterized protein L969DRAFT_92801 [Mixia osmundae IAM 14324]KEI41573.1 hypothetical protein L969DRAFT_92801 [Mixia osmundae IAM 14324]GAA95674.1 hypothetical protein E5Q_02331 [Mixia osmundae IAM 14324]